MKTFIIWMDQGFFKYLAQLELMAFLSAYPLIYALAFFIAGKKDPPSDLKQRIKKLLPFAYALVGTLYLGLQLKYFFDPSSQLRLSLPHPWLTAWALLSLLFWIPVISKRTWLSLIHSLVFFFWLVKDIVLFSIEKVDRSILKNSMNVYTTSIIINSICFFILLGLSFLVHKRKRPS